MLLRGVHLNVGYQSDTRPDSSKVGNCGVRVLYIEGWYITRGNNQSD